MGRLKTKEEFVREANLKHHCEYDYSLLIYTGQHCKGVFICRIHGEFEQSCKFHLKSNGCPKCLGPSRPKLTLEEFITRAKIQHGEKYSYNEFIYEGYHVKGKIYCKLHNTFFEQTPASHLQGTGCPRCSNSHIPTTQEFIENAKKIHGDKYDYTPTIYTKSKEKIKISCNLHGIFETTPNWHLDEVGCPKCVHTISFRETTWLNIMGIPDDIEHRQAKLPGFRFKVDGYDPEHKTVYEFWGNYWHGNPRKFDSSEMNLIAKKTYGELYKNTLDKILKIEAAGYKIISIWEDEFLLQYPEFK